MGRSAQPRAPRGWVELEVLSKRARIGLLAQLSGVLSDSAHGSKSIRTPYGVVEVIHYGQRVVARGDGVPSASIEASDQMTIARVKQGVTGRVDSSNVNIIRPRYGLRRRDRSVLIDGEGFAWCSEYRASRHFDILRRNDGSAVYRQDGTIQLLASDASAAETALALVLVHAGVIETSSLVNFLTL